MAEFDPALSRALDEALVEFEEAGSSLRTAMSRWQAASRKLKRLQQLMPEEPR